MKIAIIGAAGVRTPLILQAIASRQSSLGLSELALMDIDGERLELIGALTSQTEKSSETKFQINRTTNARKALTAADFVITTFRVGGIESRVIDERVPLNYGVLGQETTGPGGFAMGMRSIPVLMDYIKLMREVCPKAWLINFANPAGMLTEAVIKNAGWQRAVGICDAPASMQLVASAVLGAKQNEVYLDYFGLNHLGWIRKIIYQNQDQLPRLISHLLASGGIPGLPFDTEFIASLGMIPNEYLFYYYYTTQAVNNILRAGESRGEQIASLNLQLFAELKEKYKQKDFAAMEAAYKDYQDRRGGTYMVRETGKTHDFSSVDSKLMESLSNEGYAGVALNLIEALLGSKSLVQILNVPNQGAIFGMETEDVVEIPTLVSRDRIQPMAVGDLPAHCLGLIKQVKQYERLTIEAAIEGSYQKALLGLTLHPLIHDYPTAKSILDEYITKHANLFPALT
jgi:6-phospho-beta-glucosidase